MPASSTVKRRLRAALSWLHLWLGLGAGTVLALIGLSGTVLVFHDDLLAWQHPQLVGHMAVADGRVLTELLGEWNPQGLRSVHLPQEPLPVWQGFFEDGRRGYFSPGNGELLLMRNRHDDWLLWLHELHTDLLAEETGRELLGIVGWIALGLVLTGLYLWWPRWGRIRSQLRVYQGPPVRRWLSWHRTAGAVLFPLLLLSILSGVGMVYHGGARALLTALLGGDAATAAPSRVVTQGVLPDWPQILANAAVALPGAQLTRTAMPEPGSGVIAFRARAAGEWHPNGRSLVFVDVANAKVLRVHDATGQKLGARVTESIYPLHIGSVGGAPFKWLTALGGLLPTFLLVTGFLFWRRRRERSPVRP